MHVAFCLYPLYLEAVHIIPTVTRYTLVVSLPLSTPAPLPVAKMLTLSSRTTAMRPAPKPSAHSIRHLALRGAPRVSTRAAAPDGVGMSPELRANIDNLIASNKVVVRVNLCDGLSMHYARWIVNAQRFAVHPARSRCS